MTKIKSLKGRFQKVAVQYEDKGDAKIIDYKDIPLEDPERIFYNLSSMQFSKDVKFLTAFHFLYFRGRSRYRVH